MGQKQKSSQSRPVSESGGEGERGRGGIGSTSYTLVSRALACAHSPSPPPPITPTFLASCSSSAESNGDNLVPQCIILSLGARYKGYCSNVARTLLVDPTKDQSLEFRGSARPALFPLPPQMRFPSLRTTDACPRVHRLSPLISHPLSLASSPPPPPPACSRRRRP